MLKNKNKLVENGETPLDRKARKLALDSLETALLTVDPIRILKSKLLLSKCKLRVDEISLDLESFRNIYVVGGGKASGSMAEAIEQILGKRIKSGLVNVPYGSKSETDIIRLHEASHPVPDNAGIQGTRRMLELAEQAQNDDLFICLISGGGSSLMPLPRDEISLADKQKITEGLLRSGATINETNTVRKHISGFKGGWFAKKSYPATILNLILSDVVGDHLDFIASGPTTPDSTTFKDAVKILKRHNLWSDAPESIRKVLSDGIKGRIPETPKANDSAFTKVYNVIVGNNRTSCLAASRQLESAGLNTLLLTSTLEGEARHVGVMFASIAHEVHSSGNPVSKPGGIVAGGETTVTVSGRGIGGRNQEIALAAASKLEDVDGIVVASLNTDGIDGPTDAAGVIVDGKILAKATEVGLASDAFLVDNDSYHFFSRLGDLIFTGPTGTNVNDISIIVVL